MGHRPEALARVIDFPALLPAADVHVQKPEE